VTLVDFVLGVALLAIVPFFFGGLGGHIERRHKSRNRFIQFAQSFAQAIAHGRT
jgi:hypothetical protein